MRILELFGGYGSQALALENLGIDFTSDLCEIDKYAIQAYNQLHGETHNWGDICKIDETQLPYYDLITYSSPCQDFSVAGKQAGGDKGSGTRSSLLWECERIIRAVKPKYLLMENVKNLVGKKHMHNFIAWLRTLESMGYKNWWQVLNAKDYGVPQNRERVFVVSILGGGQYQFPEPIPLTRRLKDVLEPQVDEKYYLSGELVKRFVKSTENPKYPFGKEYKVLGSTSSKFEEDTTKSRLWVMSAEGVSPTLDATQYKTPKQIIEPIIIGGMQANQSVKTDGVCTCLTSSMGIGGGYVPMVTDPLAYDEQNGYIRKDGCVGTLTTDGSSPKHNNRVVEPLYIKENTSKGYEKAYEGDSINLEQPNSKTRRGRVGHQMANTLTCSCNQGVVEPKVINPLAGKSDFGWHFEQEVYDEKGIARAVKAGGGSGNIPKVMQVGNIVHTGNFENPQRGRIYSSNGCSPALSTMQGGGLEPKIVDDIYPSREPRVYENTCPTLRMHHAGDLKVMDYRIRKLTPRECWRLMGVKDEQFDKLHDISNSQLYKMAGNSIVVDVLMGIFKNLFMPTKQKGQLELF